MFEFLQYEFVRNALFAGFLVSISTSMLGVYLILRRLSLIGDGLAHAAFGGIAVGFLLGVNPLLTALIFSALGSLGINRLISKAKVYGDSAIALVLSSGMALAIVIIGYVRGFNANLFSYLFGSILSVSFSDLLMLFVVALATLGFIVLNYRSLLAVTFNDEIARVHGVRVSLLHNALIVLTACAVVVSIRAVGILLVTGLLVIPPMTSLLVSSSFRGAMVYSLLFSLFSMLLGVILAFLLDLPPGGMIVLSMVAVFLVVLFVKGKK